MIASVKCEFHALRSGSRLGRDRNPVSCRIAAIFHRRWIPRLISAALSELRGRSFHPLNRLTGVATAVHRQADAQTQTHLAAATWRLNWIQRFFKSLSGAVATSSLLVVRMRSYCIPPHGRTPLNKWFALINNWTGINNRHATGNCKFRFEPDLVSALLAQIEAI